MIITPVNNMPKQYYAGKPRPRSVVDEYTRSADVPNPTLDLNAISFNAVLGDTIIVSQNLANRVNSPNPRKRVIKEI